MWLVKVERGTGRGGRQWREKLETYDALFENRSALAAATGYFNARILVLCPGGRRRDGLADGIS